MAVPADDSYVFQKLPGSDGPFRQGVNSKDGYHYAEKNRPNKQELKNAVANRKNTLRDLLYKNRLHK
jgi:hypothetical protein